MLDYEHCIDCGQLARSNGYVAFCDCHQPAPWCAECHDWHGSDEQHSATDDTERITRADAHNNASVPLSAGEAMHLTCCSVFPCESCQAYARRIGAVCGECDDPLTALRTHR